MSWAAVSRAEFSSRTSRREFLRRLSGLGIAVSGAPFTARLFASDAGNLPARALIFPGPWQFLLPKASIILVSDQQLEDLEDPNKPVDLSLSSTPNVTTLRKICEGAKAQGARGGEIEVDRGREPDSGERTPVPTETATCPWCGTASPGAICDTCGRRKARFAEPPPEERRASVEGTITCPACFARVAREVRCSDCGMPFPLQEL